MNFKQYQKETIRTFAFRQTSLTTTMTDMLHCAIGIATEVGELIEAFSKDNQDEVNIGEEIADQMWYISNLSNFIKFDLETECCLRNTICYKDTNRYLDEQVILSGELLDIFKKTIYYNKELNLIDIKVILIRMTNNLNELSKYKGMNIYDLLDKNISKLKIRFPEKFTEELSQNRDLKSERKALED